MSQTKKFKSDRRYGWMGERLVASRLFSRYGAARTDPRLIAESSITSRWELDSRGRVLIPLDRTGADGVICRSPLLNPKTEWATDLVQIPLANGGYIEIPTKVLARIVRRGNRELIKDEGLSQFELITGMREDGQQQTRLAVPACELLSASGKVGLQNALSELNLRAQTATNDLDPTTLIMDRPSTVCLPVDAWHVLANDYPVATRPEAARNKDFDLFVTTELDDAGAIAQTLSAEVKADRRYFETGNVFVELSHKRQPAGVMATKADAFVFVFGSVTVVLPTSWLRARVQAIAAATGNARAKSNANDDGLVAGIVLRPEELLVAELRLVVNIENQPGAEAMTHLHQIAGRHPGQSTVVLNTAGVGIIQDDTALPTVAFTRELVDELHQLAGYQSLSWEQGPALVTKLSTQPWGQFPSTSTHDELVPF